MTDEPQMALNDWDEENMKISKGMLLPSTIAMGLLALGETIAPILTWYLWLDKYHHADNKWTKNAWMALWIGNLVVFGPAALMWGFSYLGGDASAVYLWLWGWINSLASI